MSDTSVTEETKTDVRHTPLFKVLLHDDSVNTIEHVIQCVMQIFKYEFEKAHKITMEVHEEGISLCTVEPEEHAEFHQDQLQSFGLTCTIEPE